jgi:hypothetical protein
VAVPPTVKVQLVKLPLAVVMQALGDPTVPDPLSVKPMLFPGVNPVPEAVTRTPLGPRTGDGVIAGVVTVNAGELVFEFAEPSVADGVSVLGEPEGTVKLHTKPPYRPVVPPLACVQSPVPLDVVSEKVTDPAHVMVIGLPAANPVPVAVTVAPIGPWVGER